MTEADGVQVGILRTRLRSALWAPHDVAALAVFRIVFSTMMLVSVLRYFAYGWIEQFFVIPTFHFKYWGLSWLKVGPAWVMYGLFVLMALCALFMLLGLFYRVASALWFLAFTYMATGDVTYYLNHYYLVWLLSLIVMILPLHRAWSLDVRRNPRLRVQSFPAWFTYLLRAQVGAVYFFAGIAKFNEDWLLSAQPLSIWLSARTHLPVIGPLLGHPVAWYGFSWMGFLFDTTIVLFLSLRKTRAAAYAVVVFFHIMTRVLFPIGIFSAVMVVGALAFFEPDWPRRLAAFVGARFAPLKSWADNLTAGMVRPLPPVTASVWTRRLFPLALCFVIFQMAWPLRHRLYGGNVSWHEQGMRFSWKVMLREKSGAVTFVVFTPDDGRTEYVPPRAYLSSLQDREMAGQPDLILQLAHHIAADYRAKGHREVQVRAQTRVSFNGRPGTALIDPHVDLAQVSDGLSRAPWILPEPSSRPIKLRSTFAPPGGASGKSLNAKL